MAEKEASAILFSNPALARGSSLFDVEGQEGVCAPSDSVDLLIFVPFDAQLCLCGLIVPAFNPAARGRIEGSSHLNFKMLLFQGHALGLRRWMDFHQEMFCFRSKKCPTDSVPK